MNTPVLRRTARSLLALLPMLAVLAFRLCGPEDLDDNDQAKQALYALDVRENANWILPQERGTLPASRPPLYTWLAASASLAWSDPSALACRLPSALASLLLVLVVMVLAEERFGASAGLYAGWLLASTHTVVNLSVHVRPDAVLALLCTAALFALHRVELGRPAGSAPLFWISCSLSILAKGPVGLLVPFGGALALCGSRETRPALFRVLCSGWAAMLLLPLVWLVLAYLVGGSQYLSETLLPETVDRALGLGARSAHAAIPGQLLGHFLVKGLPVSLLTLPALAWLRTREGRARHARLRLPCAGFAVGLVLLSLSREQRQDCILPFLPPAAVVAGAVLSEAVPVARRLWSALLFLASAAALVGGLLAWLGPPIAPAQLLPLGSGSGILLALAGLVLATLAVLALGAASAPRRVHIVAGVTAMLALHALYNGVLSPVAQSMRERDVRAFSASVREVASPRDRLRIASGVRGSVFFFLGHNEAALSDEELVAYDSWNPPGGRLLLVTRAAQRPALDARWPGRFKLLASRDFSRSSDGLVLLEDSSARSAL